MSSGGGQFTVLQALASDGEVSPLAKLYHYAEGTTTLKNIYSDEAMTATLAQPFVSDQAGRFEFYASGDFKFRIDTAADVTLDTWDEYHISKGQSAILEVVTVYPAATAANVGLIVPKIASGILRGVAVNQATSFIDIYKADASGNQILSSVVSKTHPRYDITHEDWGAVAGQASEQSTAIQKAITAIALVGSGVLYIPAGTYQVDSSLIISNTSIKIVGDGAEHSILKQTSDPSAPVLDYDSNNQDDKCIIEGISVTTTVVGSTTGIDVAFTGGGVDDRTNLYINDVYVGPHASASATAYFASNILATGSVTSVQKPIITNSMVSGHDTQTSGSAGISISGADYSKISNVTFQNLGVALNINYVNNSTITGNVFRSVDYGIYTAESTFSNTITGNDFSFVVTNGIRFNGPAPRTHWWNAITGNTMNTGDSACKLIYFDAGTGATNNTITGNTLKGTTGGTCTGIQIDSGSDNNVISGNMFDTLDSGIVVASDGNAMTGNLFDTVTADITDSGANYQGNNFPYAFATVASAAALGSGETALKSSDVWNVTGTVNVTSMHADASPWIGRTVTLVFAAILTFTNGNNLKLAGNFVTTADDTITLIYDGTNWSEVSRTVVT